MRRRARAADPHRPRRQVERAAPRSTSCAPRTRCSQVENGNYRATTGELTTQIQSLEDVIDDLGARAHARSGAGARDAEAAGGREGARRRRRRGQRERRDRRASLPRALIVAGRHVRRAARPAAAVSRAGCATCAATSSGRRRWPAATPSIWPAHGWLTGTFGGRADPFTGEPGFHQGLDISTDKGQPVYATADGTVESAAYTGDYGNLIVLEHDFGLTTRYGHLSRFNVEARASASSAATSSATSARPAARPAPTCTTRSSPTAS